MMHWFKEKLAIW